jgi:bifunctional DNA-binding transcriptional regulator/antitoxin component of YhaV-PrlF toxin-antitoxin module
MNSTIKLTSKRQATLPVEVCEQLGVKPGDELDLIPRVENGERFWVLQKHGAPARAWFGSLRAYAKNATDHSAEAIRESIARRRKSGS